MRRSYPTFEIYNSYSWVEVIRETHIEGLIDGNLTYGCWFHKFHGILLLIDYYHNYLIISDNNNNLSIY